jgi:HSP20 family protein
MTPYEQRKNQVVVRKPRDIFDYFFGDDFLPVFQNGFSTSFNADIRDLDKEYVIEAEMPGLTKEDIKIDLHDDIMTISAEKKAESSEESGSYVRRERRFGTFSRSFRVEDIKQEGINAKFDNGVLRISLPKQETSSGQRQVIDIN